MSASKHVTLWCDFEDCNAWTDHGQRGVRETRTLAQGEGWICRAGNDYCCPAHAEGRKTQDEVTKEAWDAKQRARIQS